MRRNAIVRHAVRVALWGGLLAGVAPGFVVAQNQQVEDEVLEEVIITGTRISIAGLDSPSPVQVISSEDIAESGVANIQDLLLKNPTLGNPLYSRTNSNFLTASAGVSTIDLRDLGTDRTLVLVNGRRFVSGVPGSAAVDLNTIPVQFIERVDILTGGASAVYGSDAVAGVVNIIYKSDFEGVEFDFQKGLSQESDDEQTQASLTLGTNISDGRGNIMAHIGYTKQGPVYSKDRDRSAVDQASLGAYETGLPEDMFTVIRPYYSGYAPQGRFFTANGPAAGITYDASGNVIPWDTNGETTSATGFNRSEYRTIAVPTTRYLLATRGTYEIADQHRVFAEGTYANTHTVSKIEPFPLASEDIYPATAQVPLEFDVNGTILVNPLVPDEIVDTAADEDGDGFRDYYFTRRLAEVGTRGNEADRSTFRVLGGLEGALFGDWKYEAFYGYGQTSETQTSNGQVNVLNFRNALEAIPDVDDIDGDGDTTEAICRDANARAQGCVPANVFGYGSISNEALAYITAPGSYNTLTSQKLFGVNLTGTVLNLPAGDLAIAVGGEYRKEYSSSAYDALAQAGLNASNAIPPTKGSFDVTEEYLEANVPVLAGLHGAQQLDVRGAIRFADYSTVGNTTSWNLGLEWVPVSQLKIRAIRALSTRAPNITELFSPPSQDYPSGLTDPCLGVTATSVGAADDACRADPGVAANIAANGAFTLSQADLQGISGYDRGNPDLQEEVGRSWTVGLVYTPEDIPVLENFDVTIDYFNIDIEDAIVPTPRQFILEQCYGGDSAFCQYITRRSDQVGAYSAGSLEFIDQLSTNSGGTSTEGIDLALGYSQRLGAGDLRAKLSYTHIIDAYTIPLPGADKDNGDGEIGSEAGDALPKNRAQLNLGYDWKNFGITWTTNYIGPMDLDDQFMLAYGLEPGSVGVGSATYHDLYFKYEPNERYEAYFGVNNLFDLEPKPLITGLPGDDTGTETAAGIYDPIGRRFYAGIRIKL